MSSTQADSDIVDCTDSADFRDNVIVMEVDNLLVGWPAYEIKFTPKKPGPVKLIIRLKDAVKFMHVEESTDSEAELLFSSNGRKRARKNKKIKTGSAIEANTIVNALAALKITSTSSDSTSFHANPVRLVGIRERPPAPVRVPLKPKFSDDNIPWPPIRPRRALRDIKTDEGTNLFEMVKAIPAAVAPDNTYT
ncbi:hypothetical protein DEU56DRAFT_919953 [Suillus clintonianus]|uniref:uncharacterized protein n=1 Tax=Suillus clintonianus TaxID=1904413 RepID=UPI001B87687B|nr:uncharacterized protein DEU56DRAFT_919953 [Suillus clintonianus]KAG2111762.1 hypothetical protein DEU56DRAFT_919953 [Suillus clintonianus]